MLNNDNVQEQTFGEKAICFKKDAKEFFASYESPNLDEDKLEICLIRDGYRAVLEAEERICQLKNEAEKIKNQIELKAIEEFAERLKEQIATRIVELKATKSKYVKENYKCLGCDYIAKIRGEIEFLESLKEFIDNLLKEMAGEE